jgi:hypothetical protein
MSQYPYTREGYSRDDIHFEDILNYDNRFFSVRLHLLTASIIGGVSLDHPFSNEVKVLRHSFRNRIAKVCVCSKLAPLLQGCPHGV